MLRNCLKKQTKLFFAKCVFAGLFFGVKVGVNFSRVFSFIWIVGLRDIIFKC